jgi:hypothetical protein
MAAKISQEKKEMIRKFCQTHPKVDAIRRFGIAKSTILSITKGINWKKRN